MRCLLFASAWLLIFCLPATLTAQITLSPDKYQALPVERMPAQDNDRLRARELEARKPERVPEFAVALPVAIRPSTHGQWTREGNVSVWRHRISSPGAKTLNLGFSEYRLPTGAELRLITPEETVGPFTVADNDEHDQLWTPVVGGDELLLELRLPTHRVKEVRLFLTFVNHDFMDIRRTLEKSGSCNLDVVCGAADGWPIVDNYRDIIRSVAAIHRNGIGFCTGFLVNNANEDGTPFFMTANHCGITPNVAPSLVTYWNYESATCRQPNSAASGGDGGGSFNVFNSGATHLASYAPSDMTLLLLDDPVDERADAFFAGWSADASAPTDTLIAIHHPNVEEKRISFAFTDAFRAPYLGSFPQAGGDHLTVSNWNIGTTEGGSSGSPIFDRNRRVRGQLHGGFASCAADDLDSYGFFHTSWTGGGTPENSLRGWLDPCGTGTTTIDGFEQSAIDRSLIAATNCLSGCTSTSNLLTFTLGDDFPAGTSLTINAPDVFSPTLSATTATGGQAVTLNVTGDDVPTGSYVVTVLASGGGVSDEIDFYLDLNAGTAPPPALNFPNDGATDVFPAVNFTWAPVNMAAGYDFELALNGDFTALVAQVSGLEGTGVMPDAELAANRTYYWRVRTVNDCGGGEWSSRSFTTANVNCTANSATDTPVEISPGAPNDYESTVNVSSSAEADDIEVYLAIQHTYVGDLSARLVSPSGTSIQLFTEVEGGGCGGRNLEVTFRDNATSTHADFVGTCTEETPTVSGTYQPSQALSTFTGEPITGNWTLEIRDDANLDGGAITDFTLQFCGRQSARDLDVQASVGSLEVCEDGDPVTLDLAVGADFVGDLSLRAEAGGQMLDNYTFGYEATDRVLTVAFSAWTLIGTGDYTLQLTVIDDEGTERSTNVALRVNGNPGQAFPDAPADNALVPAGDVAVSWIAGQNTDGYTVEYSVNADFSVITGRVAANGTAARLSNLPEGVSPIYWRVVSEGPCGSVTGPVSQFRIETSAVHDFGGDRQLNVYPNPVRRYLTLEATGNWAGGVTGLLLTAEGRTVRHYRLAGAGRTEWDLGVLPAGVYYLRLSSQGAQRTERLVVLP